jgi:AraC family transcriptional activator of pobA
MTSATHILRYGLYGEAPDGIAPEFVHIETISARSSLHDWTISPHAHNGIFQLLLVRSGEALLATDGGEFALTLPTLVIVPCGCAHAFRFSPETQGWVMSIADPLLLDRRLAAFGVGSFARGGAVLPLALADDAGRERLLSGLLAALEERLVRAADRLDTATMAMIALLLAAGDELVAQHSGTRAAPPDRRIDVVRRFNALLEAHFRKHWPVARYAAALGVTPPTLTRACRAVAGRSPGDMALDRLMREAMRALTYTAANVAQVADDLGFADPAYFARFFKSRAGMTASAFRRQRAWLG